MRILCAYDDPGGGLAVTCALEAVMRVPGVEITAYSGIHSMKFAEKIGLKPNPVSSKIEIHEAERIFRDASPDVLLTATGGGNAEQLLRNIARKTSVRSVVILDFWKDYSRRWMYADHSIGEIQDIICVPDDSVKAEMTGEGFPGSRIIATGHPYIEKLFSADSPASGTPGSSNRYIFLSQPSHTVKLSGYDIHPARIIAEALETVANDSGSKARLIIKLHPLESPNKEISKEALSGGLRNVDVSLSAGEASAVDLISECDTVFGFNSIAMFEASAAGKKVICIDAVPMGDSLRAALKSAGVIFTEPEKSAVANAVVNAKAGTHISRLHSGAAENCGRVILNITN